MSDERLKKPDWMKRKLPRAVGQAPLTGMLRDLNLVTVCEEARCPNLNECFSHRTATFMILGDICTRKCGFCAVATGVPRAPDPHEPANLAEAIRRMGLRHAVITSVNRDDLDDGGANHWKSVIERAKALNPTTTIEVLTPDFKGIEWQADLVIEAQPAVYNHNIETTERLTKRVRVGARYETSLKLLRYVKERAPEMQTKSGIMLGLGEEYEEVIQTFRDLRDAGVDILTVGQYLQPSSKHLPIERYVTPKEFDDLKYEAMMMGFSTVASGTYVRSSYNAEETFLDAIRQ